jgi:hypothetical protein
MSYSNQYSRGKRKHGQQGGGWPRIIFAAVILVLISVVIFIFYEYKQHPAWGESVADYRSRFSAWVAERKQHLNQKVVSIKHDVVDSDEADRAVNFEFYNTLQDAQPMQAAAQAEMKRNIEQKSIAKAAPVAKAVKSAKIIHAADLEKDLLAAIKQGGGK